MRKAAVAFDGQLCAGLDDNDIVHLEHLLALLHNNVTDQVDPARQNQA